MRPHLQNDRGAALVLVLCIGALFVSLSAALVYAAGQLTASADGLYWEQDAYRQARSFSECIGQELCGGGDSGLKDFLNGRFLSGQTYAQHTAYRFEGEDPGGSGFAALDVSLSAERFLNGAENPGTVCFQTGDEARQWAQSCAGRLCDCAVTVKVTARTEKTACTYTPVYLRSGRFPLVVDTGSGLYQASEDGLLYPLGRPQGEPLPWTELLGQQLSCYFSIEDGTDLQFEKEGSTDEVWQDPSRAGGQ